MAGAATGVVEYADVLGPQRVAPGDVVLGLASSGLHSNGYSLVRRVIAHAGWTLDRHVDDFGRTLGEELLEPTRIYARMTRSLFGEFRIKGAAHITGGGITGNLPRVLPQGRHATIERASWRASTSSSAGSRSTRCR